MQTDTDINTDINTNSGVDAGNDRKLPDDRTTLILGATGNVGDEVVPQLRDAGWDVCALEHSAESPLEKRDDMTWLAGDAMNREQVIAAASTEGATVVLPGTLYNYGPDAVPMISEHSPQHPQTRKGAIRVRMEERLRAFAERSGRVLIVRAGDYFGPKTGSSWFSQGLVKPNMPVSKILNPATRGGGHEWGYLPDVARTMVE